MDVQETPTTTATPSSATKRDVEDGKDYIHRKALYPPRCRTHTPTLEELQKLSFSEYVRQVVLDGARAPYEDEPPENSDDEEEQPR